MRWGLSWGAQAPHHIVVAGMRYEVRTTHIAGVCTAYGTVSGLCIEATGDDERAARQNWQTTVEAMTPLLEVERRVESTLDEAAAALVSEAQADASDDHAAASSDPFIDAGPRTTSFDAANLNNASAAPADTRPLPPLETCEVRRSADRRLTDRRRRER